MTKTTIPSMIDWELMDRLEQAVWGTAFALGLSHEPTDGARAATVADEAVRHTRSAAPERHPPQDPAARAARVGIAIAREEFDAWYRVEVRLAGGVGRVPRSLSTAELDVAYETYARGRNDFF
jgi:hypothetical protein